MTIIVLVQVFQEFVETFQEAPLNGSSKVWVKAGTYDAGARSMTMFIVFVKCFLVSNTCYCILRGGH